MSACRPQLWIAIAPDRYNEGDNLILQIFKSLLFVSTKPYELPPSR